MWKLILVTLAALHNPIGHAADVPPNPLLKSAAPANNASSRDIGAVTSVGAGQAGYVHYFLITHPDGDLEYQVGIELDDQRIAWSFPNAGVMVSPFVKKGLLDANGKTFKIEHLHGIRPFPSGPKMETLRKELAARVARWVDDGAPYCLFRQPGQHFCLSCGDFVVRILYPGSLPLTPALPRDFLRVTGNAYTTDDLLLYFLGLHDLPDKKSQLSRLATLEIPKNMRDDVITMLEESDASVQHVPVAALPKPSPVPAATPAVGKPLVTPPSNGRLVSRRANARRL